MVKKELVQISRTFYKNKIKICACVYSDWGSGAAAAVDTKKVKNNLLNKMATEKTSLLQKIILRPKEPKMYTECLINIPLLLDDEVDYCEELTYEQLLPYKDDVWWQTLRRTCMVLFWLIIFLMSASACLISFLEHQKTCPVSNIKLIINNSNKVIPNIITLVDTALNVTNIQHSPAAVLLP